MTKEEARAKLHVEIATEVAKRCMKESKVTAMEGTAVFLSILTEHLASLWRQCLTRQSPQRQAGGP